MNEDEVIAINQLKADFKEMDIEQKVDILMKIIDSQIDDIYYHDLDVYGIAVEAYMLKHYISMLRQ